MNVLGDEFDRSAEAIAHDAHTLELVAIRRELTQPVSYLSASLAVIRQRLERRKDSAASGLFAAVLAATQSANELVEIVRHVGAFDLAEAITDVDLASFVTGTLRLIEPELERQARVVTEFEAEARVTAARRALRKVLISALSFVIHHADPELRRGRVVSIRVERRDETTAVLSVHTKRFAAVGGTPDASERLREAATGQSARRAATVNETGRELAACRRLMQSFGGTLLVEQREDARVLMFFRLAIAAT